MVVGIPEEVVGRTSSGLMIPAIGFVMKRGVGIGELAECWVPLPRFPPTTCLMTTPLPLAIPELERMRREGVNDCAAIGTKTFGRLCCGVVADPAEEEGEYDAPAGVVGLEELLSETNMLAASILAAASLSNFVVDAERCCEAEAVASLAAAAAFLM